MRPENTVRYLKKKEKNTIMIV